MKRILKTALILVVVIGLVLPLTGCGKAEEEDKNTTKKPGTSGQNNEKAAILSDSYTKFTEAKGAAIDKLGEVEDFTISMSLFGLVMIDLLALPATVCGLEEAAVKTTLSFFYNDISYKDEGNGKYTFNYSTEEGEEGTFIAHYDEKTDSAKMEMYIGEDLALKIEYIKTSDGYAAQYFLYNEDGTYGLYKLVFTDKDIILGMYEAEGAEPESLYKGNGKIAHNWAENEEFYVQHINGVTTAVIDGEARTY